MEEETLGPRMGGCRRRVASPAPAPAPDLTCTLLSLWLTFSGPSCWLLLPHWPLLKTIVSDDKEASLVEVCFMASLAVPAV